MADHHRREERAGVTSQYVAIFSDITARKQAEEEIRNLAFYDALTQLPNRRLFLERFHAALTASARYADFGAILFIDLDRFKLLNDTLGHDYGDLLLVEVAARIKYCVREMDTVARLGGDEFVVLLESISGDRRMHRTRPNWWRRRSARHCRVPTSSRNVNTTARPASVSPCITAARRRWMCCSNTPMPRCIRPRAPGAIPCVSTIRAGERHAPPHRELLGVEDGEAVR